MLKVIKQLIIIAKWNKYEVYATNIYLFKFNNRNARKRCEIGSKITIKTPKRGLCRCSDVFIVKFEHISHLFLGFLLLSLNKVLKRKLFALI